MEALLLAVLLATLAGTAIPLGGFLASMERIRPDWLELEFRHSVIAFGGGALLAAVSLVLVPEGLEKLPPFWMALSFSAGGACFFAVDRAIQTRGTSAAQLMALMLDFVPEAMALGATLGTGQPVGLLLALLIALQNFPEGFNAYRELMQSGAPSTWILRFFWGLVLLGPVSVILGYVILGTHQEALGVVMLFSAGGILYLTFEDIAPQAQLERAWAPPLGAVAGFLLGLIGHVVIG